MAAARDDDTGLLIFAAVILAGGALFLYSQSGQAFWSQLTGALGTPTPQPSPPQQLPPPETGGGGYYPPGQSPPGDSYYVPPSTYDGNPPPPPPPPTNAPAVHGMSASAVSNIKAHEGLRLAKYPDGQGWSIGYGHYFPPGSNPPATITQAQAQAYLDGDVAAITAAINSAVHVPLNQNQFDALGDFVYSVGTSQFRSSTLLTKLNAGDYSGAAAEFGRWIYSHNAAGQEVQVPGLVTRRSAETALFLSPISLV